jgi:molybdopterin synthase catalytic subunit
VEAVACPSLTYDVSLMSALPICEPPEADHTWLALTEGVLPVGVVHDWAVQPDCGAVVVFSGTVRDHAEHRTDVTLLEYEAYETQVIPKLAAIEADIRRRFDGIGRVALLHRIGPLQMCEVSVVVAVSSAHRPAAFDAARFGIDALKATVPIWKRETWSGGTDWGLAATQIGDLNDIGPYPTKGSDPSDSPVRHSIEPDHGNVATS